MSVAAAAVMMGSMRVPRQLSVASTVVGLLTATLAACSETTATDELDREEVLDQAVAELVAMPAVRRARSSWCSGPGAFGACSRGGRGGVGRRAGRRRSHALASVAKAFSGAAALVLVDDAPCARRHDRRTPAGLPEAWREVTLRQLLNHTSGLPDYTANRAFGAALILAR